MLSDTFILTTPEQMFLFSNELKGKQSTLVEEFPLPEENTLRMIKNKFFSTISGSEISFLFLTRDVLLRPSLPGRAIGNREDELNHVLGKTETEHEFFHHRFQNMELIFRLSSSLVYTFRSVFPSFYPQHTGMYSITEILTRSLREYPVCLVNILKNYMELILVEKGKLKVYNVQEISGAADVLYYIIHAIRSSQSDENQTKVYIRNPLKMYPEFDDDLEKYLKNVFLEEDKMFISEIPDIHGF